MNLTRYYSLYDRFKTGKVICWGVNVARLMGIRHLLVRMDTNFCCNLKCQTCYFSTPEAKRFTLPPMKLDLFKTIAKDVFPRTRILYLSCGAEPFMTKNFENFLEEAGKYSVPFIGYVTNGLLFTEDIVRASIKSKVSEITISIDGARKETYEYIRVNGKFDTLMKKLSMYRDIASNTAGKVPQLRFNFTVTKSNHLDMPLLIGLARQFGVTLVKFRIYEDWGGSLSTEKESIIGHEKSFNENLREAKRLAAEADIEVIAPREFMLQPTGEAKTERKPSAPHILRPPCVYPWFFRYIDPLGRIRVCANLPLSQAGLGEKYTLKDFERSPEEVTRKKLLNTNPYGSCFEKVCHGAYLKRANDDINFLKE